MTARDHNRAGLALVDQRDSLIRRKVELLEAKTPKFEKPLLNVSGETLHEFCEVVSSVLTEWKFPGDRHVSFDEKTYDLRIDGKLRVDNGKGVRALTHAAFKVAMLIFCREKGLPHPGIIILDTPLLTYRDPIKNPKHGKLSPDEEILAQSSVKQCFFEHLSKIRNLGQFIILENIDPPENVLALTAMQVFHGETEEGRAGLFPTVPPEETE